MAHTPRTDLPAIGMHLALANATQVGSVTDAVAELRPLALRFASCCSLTTISPAISQLKGTYIYMPPLSTHLMPPIKLDNPAAPAPRLCDHATDCGRAGASPTRAPLESGRVDAHRLLLYNALLTDRPHPSEGARAK
jgi:hypothetical protein